VLFWYAELLLKAEEIYCQWIIFCDHVYTLCRFLSKVHKVNVMGKSWGLSLPASLNKPFLYIFRAKERLIWPDFQTFLLCYITGEIFWTKSFDVQRAVLHNICRQQYLFGCCMYSLQLLMMDRKTFWNTENVITKYNKFDTLLHLVGFTIEIKMFVLHSLTFLVADVPN